MIPLYYLGEISNDMGTQLVNFAENVKEKWLNIKVEGLVIKKELGDQAQILSIDLVLFPIHFIYG
jgi:hypothetical protein